MTEARRQRRDVVANRARIIDAATTVLREQGMGAEMRTIAKAAGVGIGTLYRHFPTREDLVHEITGGDLTELADSRLPVGLSALDALREYFTVALDHLARNQAMVDLLAGAELTDADLERCLNHLTNIGEEALARSKNDHTLATDITATDIAYQFLALVRIAQLLPPRNINHQIDLVLRGFKVM